MKRLSGIFFAVLAACLIAGCTTPNVFGDMTGDRAGAVVAAVGQTEVDRAYVDFGKLLDAVQAKHITPGSALAHKVAADIRAARDALHNSDVSGYRAAEARIKGEIA